MIALLALLACAPDIGDTGADTADSGLLALPVPEEREPVARSRTDRDGDGVPLGTDCNDLDPLVGEPALKFLDWDRDEHGAPGFVALVCPGAAGYVDTAMDCDDTRGDVNPDAYDPVGDGVDQDCNGVDG